MLPCALTSFCIFQQRHRLLWHVKAHLATFSGCSAIAQLTCFFDCFGTTTSVWVRHLRGVQEVPLLLFGMFIAFQDGARCSCFLGFAHQLFRFWFVPFAVCALVVFFSVLFCFDFVSLVAVWKPMFIRFRARHCLAACCFWLVFGSTNFCYPIWILICRRLVLSS